MELGVKLGGQVKGNGEITQVLTEAVLCDSISRKLLLIWNHMALMTPTTEDMPLRF